ncbi:MAG: class I tRNA ligase family protein, partial [Patescibacteria group bacterium]
VIDERGRLTGDVGEYQGLKVAEARVKISHAMQELGIIQKIEPNYKHNVATCYKCGNTLEPLPKPQWFVKAAPLAKPAIEAVKKGKIKIVPDRMKKVYFHWMENIRDWNISRQIVWGIRIPAYFCLQCTGVKVNPEIQSHWYLVRHGETDWNKERRNIGQIDVPLNETGIAQAKKLAEQFRHKKIDLVLSSDLSRARQTAEIIAKATGAELVIDPKLKEINAGMAQGMLEDDSNKIHGHIWKGYEEQFPGGESWKEFEKRIWHAFEAHKKRYAHRNAVLVSHADAMKMLLKNLKRLDSPSALNLADNHHGRALEFALTATPCAKCGGDIFEQDPDVFDTWFSSGQWPFATLMANGKEQMAKSNDFKTFYPTSVMETGYDILFFWVARMVMLGLYCTGKIPFKNVYLHGLVRDKDRQKMSKSKGNVIDPLGVAAEYGTDAVRMALVVGNTPGNDVVISEDKIR